MARVVRWNGEGNRDRAGAGIGTVNGIAQAAMRHRAEARGIGVVRSVDRDQWRRRVVILDRAASFAVRDGGISFTGKLHEEGLVRFDRRLPAHRDRDWLRG